MVETQYVNKAASDSCQQVRSTLVPASCVRVNMSGNDGVSFHVHRYLSISSSELWCVRALSCNSSKTKERHDTTNQLRLDTCDLSPVTCLSSPVTSNLCLERTITITRGKQFHGF